MTIIIAVALAVAFMVLSGRLAERRGRSGRTWMWLGALFGPFALIAVALLPPRRYQTTA
jgi:hypothetical protein